MKHLTKRSLLGAALATVMALPAVAQEKMSAVVIDGYPARALWVKEFTNFFIPEVDKRLAETGNYEMQWQENYGGSIVKPKGVLEGVGHQFRQDEAHARCGFDGHFERFDLKGQADA